MKLFSLLYYYFFRFDRVLLPYPKKTSEMSTEQHKQACSITRSARVHLRYICDKTLHKKGFELLDPHREEVKQENLISVIKLEGGETNGRFSSGIYQ